MTRKRTVRQYDREKTIEEEKLSKIIYAGQSAPTDRNRKTVRIILVKSKLKEIYDSAVEWLLEEVNRTGTINPLYMSSHKMAEKKKKFYGMPNIWF